MTTTADIIATLNKLATNMARLDSIVNGDTNTTVTIDSGTVPSIAKLLADIEAVFPLTGVAAWQLRKALVSQGQYSTVEASIPADTTNAINIAWMTGANVSQADTLGTAIKGYLTYSDANMTTLFNLARTMTL